MEILAPQYAHSLLHFAIPDVHSNNETQIKEGTKLELPLWLAEMLAVSQNQAGTSTLTLDLPHSLSARVLNALKADPRTLDLRALAPHFYALGARMLELFEEDEVSEVLADVSSSLESAYSHVRVLMKSSLSRNARKRSQTKHIIRVERWERGPNS